MVLRQCKCGTSFPQYNLADNKCGKCKIEASKRKKPSKLSRSKTSIKPYEDPINILRYTTRLLVLKRVAIDFVNYQEEWIQF